MCIPSDIFWLPRPPALAPPLCLPGRAQQFGPNAADSALGRELPGSAQAAGPNRRPTAKGAGTAPSLTPPDQPETSRERHTARNQGLGVHTNSIRKLPFELRGKPVGCSTSARAHRGSRDLQKTSETQRGALSCKQSGHKRIGLALAPCPSPPFPTGEQEVGHITFQQCRIVLVMLDN